MLDFFVCVSSFREREVGRMLTSHKARDGRVGKILTLADKAGRGGLANADIS